MERKAQLDHKAHRAIQVQLEQQAPQELMVKTVLKGLKVKLDPKDHKVPPELMVQKGLVTPFYLVVYLPLLIALMAVNIFSMEVMPIIMAFLTMRE